MTTAIQPKTNQTPATKPSALNFMASKLSVDPAKLLDTLKATVFKNASNEELLALVVVANVYDLNPFLKEIYAFPAKGGGIVPIVSVDGWNKMLLRQPDFDGIEFEFDHAEGGELVSCTATIYVKNRSRPVKVMEYLAECKRNTDPWNNMPHRMLRNRTLCQASRVAFGFSGIHDEEEVPALVAADAIVTTSPPPKTISVAAEVQREPGTETRARSVQDDVEAMTLDAGFNFNHVQKWGIETANIPYADSISGFAEIKTDECKRILRSKGGYIKGLEVVKNQEAA